MLGRPRTRFFIWDFVLPFAIVAVVNTTLAQIKTDIIEKYRTELQKQSTNPEMRRERAPARGMKLTEAFRSAAILAGGAAGHPRRPFREASKA